LSQPIKVKFLSSGSSGNSEKLKFLFFALSENFIYIEVILLLSSYSKATSFLLLIK